MCGVVLQPRRVSLTVHVLLAAGHLGNVGRGRCFLGGGSDVQWACVPLVSSLSLSAVSTAVR